MRSANRIRAAVRLCLMTMLALLAIVALPSCLSNEPPAPNPYGGPKGSSPIGPQVDGLALSLTADGRAAFHFAPIWVTVEVRNSSGRKPHVVSGFYSAIITNRFGGSVLSGKPVHGPWAFPLGPIRVSWPPCGPSFDANSSRYSNLELSSAYHFAVPGIYTVQVIGYVALGLKDGPPPYPCKKVNLESNIITIILF
jgi:hypothetical protein